MKNIEDINKAAIKKIVANKKITDFSPGDTIKVEEDKKEAPKVEAKAEKPTGEKK